MPPSEGCALCGSTWGNVWAEADGKRRFFCCDLCVVQYQNLVTRIKEATGWTRIGALEITGDRRGRVCRASQPGEVRGFLVAFGTEGTLRVFRELPSSS